MNSYNTRRYEMLKRVGDFGAGHADVFPPASSGAKAFAAVSAAVAALDRHNAARFSQGAAVREGSRAKVAARAALRDALRAISATAQAVALDTPGLDDKFRLPGTTGEQALLSAGRAFAQDVRACATAFISHGLPPTFRKDLDAAIRAFETAIRDDAAGRNTFAACRTACNTAMQGAMTAVWRLDAIVANRLRGDRDALAVWERARHIDRVPRTRSSAVEPALAAAAASAPAATPPAPSVTPPDAVPAQTI